jgi:hypothetical protein
VGGNLRLRRLPLRQSVKALVAENLDLAKRFVCDRLTAVKNTCAESPR